MIMIPLPFIFSLIAIYLLVREYFREDQKKPNIYWMLFLAAIAFQAILTGARFGYDLDWLRGIQSTFAVIVPPLAYLSFVKTTRLKTMLCLAVPFVIYFLAMQIDIDFIDFVLSLNNIYFLSALIWAALNISTALSWVGIGNLPKTILALWSVVLILLVSAAIDLLIVWDFWQNQGVNLQGIVGSASIFWLIFLVTAVGVVFFKTRRGNQRESVRDEKYETETFKRIEELMNTEKVFLDPELNLNRIARKLTLPARDVSRAINVATKQNVSQYVNGLRVESACEKMKNSEDSILNILYASGFNTKSNFNREFVRVKGMTPSKWRKE